MHHQLSRRHPTRSLATTATKPKPDRLNRIPRRLFRSRGRADSAGHTKPDTTAKHTDKPKVRGPIEFDSQKTPTESPSTPSGDEPATAETSQTETSSTPTSDSDRAPDSELKDAAYQSTGSSAFGRQIHGLIDDLVHQLVTALNGAGNRLTRTNRVDGAVIEWADARLIQHDLEAVVLQLIDGVLRRSDARRRGHSACHGSQRECNECSSRNCGKRQSIHLWCLPRLLLRTDGTPSGHRGLISETRSSAI